MTNPFPGIDPYIECQEWEDFHATFTTVIREVLAPQIEPRYVVRVYDRARYDLSLNYHLPLMPELVDSEKAWMSQLLSSASSDNATR